MLRLLIKWHTRRPSQKEVTMHRLITVSLLGCVIAYIALGASAAEIAPNKNAQNNIANSLNHSQ